MGNQIDGQLGSLCTVAFGAAYELTSRRAGELSNFLDMSDDLLAEPLQIRDGELAVRSRGAGLGVEHRPRQARPLPPGPTDHRTTRTSHRSQRGAPPMTHRQVHRPSRPPPRPASGASATERFHADKSPYDAVKDTPAERVDTLAREVLEAPPRDHPQAPGHLRRVQRPQGVADPGRRGRRVAAVPRRLGRARRRGGRHRATAQGNKGTIEGPYYVPDAPDHGAPGTLPMRDDEPGTPLRVPAARSRSSTARRSPAPRSRSGTPTTTASTPSSPPGMPEWNLRGSRHRRRATAGSRSHTIQPAPYQIPTDGSCGKLIAAAGWHAWRPAHLHLKVSAPGHQLLTTQLYFPGDEHNDDDIASAVKPELMLDPTAAGRRQAQRCHLRLRPRPRLRWSPCSSTCAWTSDLPLDLDPRSGPSSWPARRPTPGAATSRASGRTSGASSASTPTSRSSTSSPTTRCTRCCRGLPLFPYMAIHVTPLARHPSAI